MVAGLLGHAHPDTVRSCSQPTSDDKHNARATSPSTDDQGNRKESHLTICK
jgi:hypothetical protein